MLNTTASPYSQDWRAAEGNSVSVGWRVLEIAAVDALRRQGCRLRYENGVTHLIAEFYDENSGQLLRRQHVLNIEEFARGLADALPQKSNTKNRTIDGFVNGE